MAYAELVSSLCQLSCSIYTMHICFSIHDTHSENLSMPGHFGESAHFLLLDSETGEALNHPANALTCRGPCRCHIPARTDQAFDAVICRAIGHRELLELKKKGIPVFLTTETSPHQALQLWRQNNLPLATRSLCRTGRRKPAPAVRKETPCTAPLHMPPN